MNVPDEMVQEVIEQLEGYPLHRKRVRAALEQVLRPYPEPTHELRAMHAAWQSDREDNGKLRKQRLWCVALLLVNAVVFAGIASGIVVP